MATHSLIGRNFGNYTTIALLGEGGMGAVFEARHRFLGDRVALKVLHGTYAQNPHVSQRFYQEAKSTREIGHENIVKVLDFGQTDDGNLYLVMELLPGQPLSRVIGAGPVSEEFAATVAAAVAEGLAAAHAKGVVHRDLKPDNVIVVGDRVKILDFGIAKVLSSAANTGSGALLGTPRYMAPEQARGAKHVGPHSDVYSLGVILFEMVTGRLPFDGTEVAEVLVKIVTEPAPSPRNFAPVSPQMESLIVDCLAKDPGARPPSMGAVRERLARWAGPASSRPAHILHDPKTLALSNAPEAATRAMATTLGSANGELRSGSQTGRVALKRPLVLAAMVGSTLLALGAIGARAWRPTEQPASAGSASTATMPGNQAVAPKSVPPPPPTAATLGGGEPRSASAAGPAVARPVITSEPEGARVLVDGKAIGTTPLEVVDRDLPLQFRLHLAGYEDAPGALTEDTERVSIRLRKKAISAERKSAPHSARRSIPSSSGALPREETLD